MTRRPPFDLQGELRSFPAPLVFQMLALGGLDGRLTLRGPNATFDAYFQRGKLVFARGPGQTATVGEELVAQGLVGPEPVEEAARERLRRRTGPRIGTILVDRGLIQRPDLERVIRARIKDAIYAVVDWRDGKFTFESGAEPRDEDILLDVGLESLLLECMARLDDAKRGAAPDEGHA